MLEGGSIGILDYPDVFDAFFCVIFDDVCKGVQGALGGRGDGGRAPGYQGDEETGLEQLQRTQ